MTKQEAMITLIGHAAMNIAGVGQGIRQQVNEEEKDKVKQAIFKLWPHKWPMGRGDWYNMGLTPPQWWTEPQGDE